MLATARPHPGLAGLLERGELPRRGPLPTLAYAVLEVVLADARPASTRRTA